MIFASEDSFLSQKKLEQHLTRPIFLDETFDDDQKSIDSRLNSSFNEGQFTDYIYTVIAIMMPAMPTDKKSESLRQSKQTTH